MRRSRELVDCGEATIDVISEGAGPLVVLLPSRGRDSEDYDEVASGIAEAGYRVLRPQPRGTCRSAGPMTGLTLHDLASDVAAVIAHAGGGPAVVAGHAFGNWVARMTAADHPRLVRGVVILAAASKSYPRFAGAQRLVEAVKKAGDPAVAETERVQHLRSAFFAPGHDPGEWLKGWYPEVNQSQFEAGRATRQEEWWGAGSAPLLDLQAELDPFKPRETANELKEEFGDRVTIAVIPDASHALIPEHPAAVVAAIVAWLSKLPK